jgi:hypothetical protein
MVYLYIPTNQENNLFKNTTILIAFKTTNTITNHLKKKPNRYTQQQWHPPTGLPRVPQKVHASDWEHFQSPLQRTHTSHKNQ